MEVPRVEPKTSSSLKDFAAWISSTRKSLICSKSVSDNPDILMPFIEPIVVVVMPTR